LPLCPPHIPRPKPIGCCGMPAITIKYSYSSR
jgi:hypothetical protein